MLQNSKLAYEIPTSNEIITIFLEYKDPSFLQLRSAPWERNRLPTNLPHNENRSKMHCQIEQLKPKKKNILSTSH